jgi:hypothetical protein
MSNRSVLLPGHKAISLVQEPLSASLQESASQSLKKKHALGKHITTLNVQHLMNRRALNEAMENMAY